jgi:hypothetical protein
MFAAASLENPHDELHLEETFVADAQSGYRSREVAMKGGMRASEGLKAQTCRLAVSIVYCSWLIRQT